MKISNINSSASFGRVYAVAGQKQKITKLKEILEKSDGNSLVLDATDIYVRNQGNGLCTKSAKRGKKIAFVITGKDIDRACFMESGWGSVNGISRHIYKFIDLNNVHNNAAEIITAMKRNI